MSTVINTPEGVAFYRAAARRSALRLELEGIKRSGRTAYSIVKEVYGLKGSRKVVLEMLDEYVEGSLTIRLWPSEHYAGVAEIVEEAERRAIEKYGEGYTKDTLDANVQAFFAAGNITEEDGNDACLLIYVTVIRQYAEGREGRSAPNDGCLPPPKLTGAAAGVTERNNS